VDKIQGTDDAVKKEVDPETKEIIDSFVAEGHERLDDAEVQLEKMGCANDTDCLGSVFRLFHSVKGSAGYLGFESIKALTHEAETLIDLIIKMKIEASPEATDLILETIDALRAMIGLVERENTDEGAAKEATAMTVALHAFIVAQAALPTKTAARTSKTAPPLPNRIELSELVTAEMVERFLAECADLVDEVERKALSLAPPGKAGVAAGLDSVNEIFRAVHTIKGNSGFFGYAYLESACMGFESSLDKARKGESPLNEALVNSVIEKIDYLRSGISSVLLVDETGAPVLRAAEMPAAPGPAASAAGRASAAPTPEAEAKYKPLGEILVEMGAVGEDEIKRALEQQERPIGEILVESGATNPELVSKALEIQAASGQTERISMDEIQRKEIRVDTTKLDKLFELVGELITAESMVLNSPDLSGLKLDHFSKSFSGLNKISRDIQETVMMIRMIPLEGLFHKMTRLVRDLSRKFDKPVDFLSTGQDTEMDKNVIEQISDPLVHIIRNAIDHGLETPERRAASGKIATGTIHLDARYEGSEIWISVKDDGAGLDRERILAKAVERGMIKSEGAGGIPDKEVWALIFEPGFSTADKVTEVSGRGVGMDVVKKNLERIRGKVDIRTAPGEGTEFILKIPLTMAIIEGITVRAGGNFYSIPLGDILEFFKVAPSQLTVAERGEMAVALRGSVMPLVKLGEVFNIKNAILDPTQGIIIVVHSGGHTACILIDEVVGNQQIVVKSLSEYLGKVDGISGCSILGDGTVSFIIDTGKLLSLRLEV
jgi:two-component system chemotaxis sensor kinase CheA